MLQHDQVQRQRLLSTAVQESDIAMVVTGPDRRILFVNAGFVRMFGFTPEDVVGQLPTEILAGEHTDARLLADIRQRAIDGRGYSVELLCYTRDKRPLWVSVVASPVCDARGQLLNFVGVLTDITQTKMHEVLQHKVLEAVARDAPMVDVMNLVCREVERIAPEVVSSILEVDEQGRLHPLAAPGLPATLAQAYEGQQIGPIAGSCGTAAWRNEAVLVSDIETDPLWSAYKKLVLPLGLRACWSSPIRGADGEVLGTFAFYFRESRGPNDLHRRLVEVSLHLCALALARERSRAQIHRLAFYDALTGLPNRALLSSQAQHLLLDAQRTGVQLSLLCLNLDRFKHVNEAHGHSVGDDLLRETARRIGAGARETDIAARLSGDEFVVVLPRCSVEQAGRAIERLMVALSEPWSANAEFLHPTVGIGVAVFPEDGADVGTLIRHAGMAMRQAKGRGPGSFQFFSTDMQQAAQERAMLESDLRFALDNDKLSLHYQPQIAAPQGLYGVEALLRWFHPSLGAVPPARFIPLAEESGQIRRVGVWVLTEACRQMADWRRRGVVVPHVSVNLSASNFQDAGLPDVIAGLLRENALQPGDLMIELTEGVMLNPDSVVMGTITAVHALGVRLSMDDFGTGYSSLGYLHRLPISELKLDKSFVQDLEHSEAARALTTSVLRIGRSLGLTVVAEGVETDGQYRFLNAEQCPVVQGFLLARPSAAPDLQVWLQNHIT